MSMIKNFEAELKAFVIKVLEDLDLYHPPVSTTPTPDTGGGQQPPGNPGVSPNTGGGQQPPGVTTTHGFLKNINSATGNLYIDSGKNFPGEVSSQK